MVLPRRIRRYIGWAILLILPLLVLRSGLKDPDQLNALDRLLLRVTAPLQNAMASGIENVRGGWRRYVYLVGVEQQNELLTDANRRLMADNALLTHRVRSLERLEEALRFRKEHKIETVGVRVIARSAAPFQRIVRVRVDQGSSALRQGLAVVTPEGVVGRVSRTYGEYSDVELAVDPKSAISVNIADPHGQPKRSTAVSGAEVAVAGTPAPKGAPPEAPLARGLLRGVDGTNRYICRIDRLLRTEDVRVGDLVQTSGVANVFPKGLEVGRIVRVDKKAYGMYQEVEVAPSVDFTTLDRMLVILTPPPPKVVRLQPNAVPVAGFVP